MIHPREMALAQDILDIAQREMAHQGAIKLRTVRVAVGEATAMVPERLTFCFELLTKKFPTDKIKLIIERIPLAFRCRFCNEAFFIPEAGFVCPKCRSKNVAVISGNELIIKEIDVE